MELLLLNDDGEDTRQYNTRRSVDPRQECRLILLGGDEAAKRATCNIIFRRVQTQEKTQRGCEKIEGCVKGQCVSVVNSPSYWMEHLASLFFFSRKLRRIKSELQESISLVFPGPHAFLLVTKVGCDTGKERYLLKAIKSEFGKEALDYSVVLFINGSEQNYLQIAKNSNVKKCGGRYHFLQDTDQSVQELFSKVVKMTDKKPCKFFIPSPYEHFMKINFESWEMSKELETSRGNESKLRKELETSRGNESKLRKELETSRGNESKLRKELETSRENESKLRKELETFRGNESKLSKEGDESKLRKELETSRENECKLQKKLDNSKLRESELMSELDLRRSETEVSEVTRQQKVEDRVAEIENKEQDPQARGATPVRRGSKQLIPPNCKYFFTCSMQLHIFTGYGL
ncbi:uncharacterized protein [Salminus brasiliensis]|uniref:uncharacterized protein n=1 Tax=Salminus brasiliensis TaxID=930266 RepID=UPI003B83843D